MEVAASLDLLDSLKTRFTAEEIASTRSLLETLGGVRFDDAHSLIRFHEILLFIAAYPGSEDVRRLTWGILDAFAARARSIDDQEPFEQPEVSGIAGTSFSAVFSHATAAWLAGPGRCADVDWDRYRGEERLGSVLPLLDPRSAEDALVEANVPYRAWVDRGRGRVPALRWLTSGLPAPAYDGLRIPVRWALGDSPFSRTRLRLPVRRVFYHDATLIPRAAVSLDREIEAAGPALEPVAQGRAEKILALARDASAARYRELHGFSFGDTAHMYRAGLGRGVDVFVWGVPPEHRLPLRAYHCGMMFKNGVPVGYVETLSLFEHADAGFNLYYTFRDGETAWLYAKLLALFRHMLGVTCFSVDPYQIGLHNPEAIESGAFWFYRKLGFRPVRAKALRLALSEEQCMRSTPGHRSPAPVLRRLAKSPMIYQVPGAPPGDWDSFEIRRLAMSGWQPPGSKRAPEEAAYLRSLQSDPTLRREAIRLGSE